MFLRRCSVLVSLGSGKRTWKSFFCVTCCKFPSKHVGGVKEHVYQQEATARSFCWRLTNRSWHQILKLIKSRQGRKSRWWANFNVWVQPKQMLSGQLEHNGWEWREIKALQGVASGWEAYMQLACNLLQTVPRTLCKLRSVAGKKSSRSPMR